jgi:hypothetical protein
MNEQTLENVVVFAKVRSPHPTRFVAVRERALDQLPALPQKMLGFRAYASEQPHG